ncbi:M23 family metallopeptidase [Nocardia sp. NPDC050435]|uniref:M23 family metallopeptidase n=1 Tax=Nocardia sp. NPDC050435 TaxID=3155040 RepID=UPI0033E1FE9D
MSPAALRTTLAAVASVVLGLPILLIVMMLGEDEIRCAPITPAGPAAPAASPAPAGSRVWPMAAGTFTISDVFGSRGGDHQGVDMAAAEDTPIYAAADGVVAEAGPASGFGQWIVLAHNIDGQVVGTVYGHMYTSGVLVAAGDAVRAGQQIALAGSNGQSTGTHLHFEVWPGGRYGGQRPIDPMGWLEGAGQPGTPSGPAPTTTPPPVTAAPDPAADPGATASSPPPVAAPPATCLPGTTMTPGGGGVDDLAEGTVPAEYEQWYRRAGQLCPQISAALLASQGKAESGFNPDAVSSAGAQGIAQFMPGTWPGYGEDSDGNGRTSPFDPGDAIMAQGKYMCRIAATVDGWISDGSVRDSGDRRELYLAAYNAGEGAVLRSGGFPTGSPDYEIQTRPYVDKILAGTAAFSKTLS